MKKYNFLNFLFVMPFLLGLYVAVNDGVILHFERAVFDFIRIISPYADIPMRVITELGSAVGVICITVVIVVVSVIKKHFFDFGLPIALTAVISRIVNITLKNILARPRPEFMVLEASESSFPSGHAQNNMALYIAILIATLLICHTPKLCLAVKFGCIVLPILIGLSRVYFGVHYISDVISGWSVGVIVAYNICYLYFKIIYPKFKLKENVSNEKS